MTLPKALNPSAPTFITGGGCQGGGAFTTDVDKMTASTFDLNISGSNRHTAEDCFSVPVPPHNTPVNQSLNSSPVPKVTATLGHGWKSAFPANTGVTLPDVSKRNTNATKRLHTPLNNTDMAFTRHRSKSPSLPGVPPSYISYEMRPEYGYNSDNASYTSHKAQEALKFINTSPSQKSHLNLFDYGCDDEDEIRLDYTKAPTQSSPVRTTGITAVQPTTPKRSTVSYGNGQYYFAADEGVAESNHSDDIGEGRNVYLSDLKSSATEGLLRKIGQAFGRVVSVKVEHTASMTPEAFDMLPDGIHGGTRTYAFVMFDSSEAADKFMQYMIENKIAAQHGKETPHLKQKALEDPHSSNLYVAEIPLDYTEQEMCDLFSPGVVSSLRFLTDDQGNRRGTAMVRLQSRVQAEDAIRRLDLNITIPGCAKPLQVRIADSENQKLFKKHTPRPAEKFEMGCRQSSIATPPSQLQTLFGDDLQTQKLQDHIRACQEELLRRQSNGIRHKASALFHEHDSPRPRLSEDGSDVFLSKTSAARRPSLPSPCGYDTTPSPKSTFDNRFDFGARKPNSSWDLTEQLSGSASTASSFGSLRMTKDTKDSTTHARSLSEFFSSRPIF